MVASVLFIFMTYKQKLKRNIRLFRWTSLFGGMVFSAAIWVSFYTRIVNFTQLSLLTALSFGVTTVFELPTGALADLMGRRKTIILGYLLFGVLDIYVAFASNIYMLLVVFILSGVADALISGSDVALLFDSLKGLGKDKSFIKVSAKNGVIFRSALVVATLSGGYLYKTSVKLPYILMGLSRLVIVFFVFKMTEPKIDTEKFSLRSYVRQTRDGFKELFKSSYMRRLTVFYAFVGGITWSCLRYFNQPFAKELGFADIERSWLFALVFLGVSLLLLFLTKKEELLTRNRVYLGFPLIMLLALLPGVFATKTLVPIFISGTIFTGVARFVILNRYTNKEFLSKYRATAISALNMLVSLFYIILVGLSGPIQDTYGTKLIFTILGGLTLIFVLPSGLSLVREYKRYLSSQK